MKTARPSLSNDLDVYRNAMPVRTALDHFGIHINGTGFIACLLHAEKTPSMKDYGDHLYCHSCGGRLDLIALIQHVASYDFWGAINWIADTSNLPRPQRDPEAQKRYEEIQSVSDTYAQVFQDSLKDPEPAIAYLEKRGIARDTTTGNVGYLPPNYKPANVEAAKRAGLYSEKGNFLFWDRLIIPIADRGRIVSLYGRALDPKRIPTHVYPGTTDPSMPATLWNLDACRKEKAIYFAEAIIDAITLIDRGVKNTVGLFGTQGFTDARLEALRKTSIEKITLCLDSDSNGSGQKGALKTGEKLFRTGYDVQILELPMEPGQEKTDPNSYFQSHDIDDFRKLPTSDFFTCKLNSIPTNGSPREKYKVLKPVLELISEQPELLWKEYVGILSARFPELDKRKIEKEISEHNREAESAKDDGKRFRPVVIAEQIMEQAPLFSNSGQIFRYEHGVYKPWPNEMIDQQIISILGSDTQAHQLEAGRKVLNALAYKDASEINPPGFLNLENTVLNVLSGEQFDHSPEFLSTVQTQVKFDPTAQCPLWKKVLEEILQDPKARELLAEYAGYCFTTSTKFQKGMIFVGEGGNGKNVVIDTLEQIVGPENCSAAEITDLKDKFRITELHNRLLNIANEVQSNTLIDDAKLKKVISGDVTIGERKNRDPFNFRPFAKWIIACNALPTTNDKSRGYFRRWLILRFDIQFSDTSKDDKDLRDKLKGELSGILNWALLGYKRLTANGRFTLPESSLQALDDYRRDIDPSLDFIDEHIDVLPKGINGGTFLKDIYEVYGPWIGSKGRGKASDRSLKKAIEANLKIKAKTRNGKTYFPGLVLKPNSHEQAQA